MKNKIIVAAIALVAVFLVGFVPQYVKANRLENELRQSRQENGGAQLRDLIGLAYVQANQKNFGLAAETTSRFFSRVREIANQTPDASSRKVLEDLLTLRDRVTAELAKGDAASRIQNLEVVSSTVVGSRQTTCMDVESLHLMAKREGYQNRIELLQGTLDMLILRTLSWGPQHGYGIGYAIRTGSADVLHAETGSLYPALHRLERQGWVRAEWRQSENRQRAKYYSLTPSGRKQLAAERSRWKRMSAAIAGLMEPMGSEG